MYQISGSRLFRITNRMQSGSDVFDKSRLVIIFLTNLRNIMQFKISSRKESK